MIVALTGTPGTGKTSVSNILKQNGLEVIDLNKISQEQGFIVKRDKKRNSNIVDIDKLNRFIRDKYSSIDLIFIEGHLSHLLKCVDKIIVLRCHPEKLRKNLGSRNWNINKIKENVEAEILDIILCEAVDLHSADNIFEIDVTDESIEDIFLIILDIVKKRFKNMKKYKIGNIDWSEEILK